MKTVIDILWNCSDSLFTCDVGDIYVRQWDSGCLYNANKNWTIPPAAQDTLVIPGLRPAKLAEESESATSKPKSIYDVFLEGNEEYAQARLKDNVINVFKKPYGTFKITDSWLNTFYITETASKFMIIANLELKKTELTK